MIRFADLLKRLPVKYEEHGAPAFDFETATPEHLQWFIRGVQSGWWYHSTTNQRAVPDVYYVGITDGETLQWALQYQWLIGAIKFRFPDITTVDLHCSDGTTYELEYK